MSSYVVNSGQTVNDIVLYGGDLLEILDGGFADDTTVNSGGYLNISNGGSATDVLMKAGGTVIANSGLQWIRHAGSSAASISEIRSDGMIVNISGLVTDSSQTWHHRLTVGGTATDVVLIGSGSGNASMTILSGATANAAVINTNGTLHLYGQASDTEVQYGQLEILSGGTATATTDNGYVTVYDGGQAVSTTVNRRMEILDGGFADDTTVNSNGYLNISSGGTVCGLHIADGGGRFCIRRGHHQL